MVRRRGGSSGDPILLLREWRKHRGYSIQTVADQARVSRATVFRIESGRSSPTVTVLAKLARALGLRVGDFFQRPGAVRRRRKRPPVTKSGPT